MYSLLYPRHLLIQFLKLKMSDLLSLLSINLAPVDNRLRQYAIQLNKFDQRLKTLSQLITFSSKKQNSVAHGKLLTRFKQKWSNSKQKEQLRLQELFTKVSQQLNAIVSLAAESVNLSFTQQFEYIFQSIEIQQKQVRSRLPYEQIPQDQPLELKQPATQKTQTLQTKHKLKHYSDLFSPAEITVQCLDICQGLIALGGWDGCVSLYSNRTGNELTFLAIQPVSEVPIKEVRLFKRVLFVRDQQNRVSMYFVGHHDLEAFGTVEVGAGGFVWISKRVLDRNFALLTVKDQALQVIDVRGEKPTKTLPSQLLKDSNYQLLNFKNKVLVICHRNILLFDNLSRTIQLSLPHSLHHDFQDLQLHNGHFLASWSHQTFYYDEFKGDTILPVFSISLELRPSFFKVQSNQMLLVSGGHVLQVMTDKRVVRITNEEMFEFGVTDVRVEGNEMYLTGRDDNGQVKVVEVQRRAEG